MSLLSPCQIFPILSQLLSNVRLFTVHVTLCRCHCHKLLLSVSLCQYLDHCIVNTFIMSTSMSPPVIIRVCSCHHLCHSCHQFTENMVTAQKRDAARQGQFYFRKNVTPPESDTEEEDEEKECAQCCPDEYTLMSADAIINGKVLATLCVCLYMHPHHTETCTHTNTHFTTPSSLLQDGFPGLIPLIHMYLSSINIDVDTRCTIRQYLSLISQRASGRWSIHTCQCLAFTSSHQHGWKVSYCLTI